MPMMPNARPTWLIYLMFSLENAQGVSKRLWAFAFVAQ